MTEQNPSHEPEVLREWKAQADERVIRALYRRAVGYTCTRTRTKEVKDRNGEIVTRETVTEETHIAPDVLAIRTWLFSRDPEHWKPFEKETEPAPEPTIERTSKPAPERDPDQPPPILDEGLEWEWDDDHHRATYGHIVSVALGAKQYGVLRRVTARTQSLHEIWQEVWGGRFTPESETIRGSCVHLSKNLSSVGIPYVVKANTYCVKIVGNSKKGDPPGAPNLF